MKGMVLDWRVQARGARAGRRAGPHFLVEEGSLAPATLAALGGRSSACSSCPSAPRRRTWRATSATALAEQGPRCPRWRCTRPNEHRRLPPAAALTGRGRRGQESRALFYSQRSRSDSWRWPFATTARSPTSARGPRRRNYALPFEVLGRWSTAAWTRRRRIHGACSPALRLRLHGARRRGATARPTRRSGRSCLVLLLRLAGACARRRRHVRREVGTSCPDAQIMLDETVHSGGGDIRGNYVLIDHGNDEFSLPVSGEAGGVVVEMARRNAGSVSDSAEAQSAASHPHLHFHIQKKSFYTSPGVPVRFRRSALRLCRTMLRPIRGRFRRRPTTTSSVSSRAA